ncbi:DNA polymerase III, delta subunit [Tessaracoccus bendigoensis DSM 12906]|uniref:DNA-directed DNA polymerase n=1 Tax=Tessaracoccus bendigoensis DSM 12906 TaxID=1123357 RepID=A0A1M6D289_9ACTN|nr:DNA polymerase III subunit delta [Tessaracoccus bendigoensis]SHI67356.1 DNA polymerase III, delta subunit [Tessaracoccus bendigoensis DSM 12906]
MPAFGSSLLITGPETLLAQRLVAATVAKARKEQPDSDLNEISASELEDTMLSEVVGGSLFSSNIIAVIDDVGACPAGVVDQLVEVARNPSEDLCLILVHAGGNKGKGLIDKLKKAKVPTESVATVKTWELPKFVVEEAKRQKMRISQDAAGELVSAVGNDLRALAAAVSQLAADSDQEQIDSDLIRRYFAGRAEVTSFAVADAVLAVNATVAMERLRWALSTGVAPVLVTSAMAGAFRGMGKYIDAQGSRISSNDLARQLGLPPWKMKDYARTSRYWGPGSVAGAIQLIAVGDAQVKGAATDPAFALERMVLGVLALARR